jgi:hypothetical protein
MSEMDRSTADILEQLRQGGAFMPGTLPPTAMGFPDLGDTMSILRGQGPTPGIPQQQTPGAAPLPAWAASGSRDGSQT